MTEVLNCPYVKICKDDLHFLFLLLMIQIACRDMQFVSLIGCLTLGSQQSATRR